jgi:predicted nucleic-acid-binding protein
MLAIDTNVVVRVLFGSNLAQSQRAKALIDRNSVFVSTTVLLETEWVLRAIYRLEARFLAKALRDFVGLEHVSSEEPARIRQALDWMEEGLDFADALHLAGAQGCEALVTFDKALIRKATRLGSLEVRAP